MKRFSVGNVISMPVGDGRLLYRILQICQNKDYFVAIAIVPKKSAGRTYFTKHKNFELDKAESALNEINGSIRLERYVQPTEYLLSDVEIQRRFPPKKSNEISRQLIMRDEKWKLIQPVIIEYTEKLYDLTLFPEIIRLYCQQHLNKNYEQKIKWYLYQYFAGGMQINALLPLFPSCGGKGKTRNSNGKKLGRPNAAVKSGFFSHQGFVLGAVDFEIIKHCWDQFVTKDVSVNAAYLRMCSEFYSVRIQNSTWETSTELLPVYQRPTESQFNYQGQKLTGKSAKQKQLKLNEYTHRLRALHGSANDGIVSVGQLAAIDTTSTDVQLVSMLSRLDRIGFAQRILLVDSLYGYIPGFYMGLSSPSAGTVKLAVLHALSDKTSWLKSLGLEYECPTSDWLPVQFANALSDNGEVRCEDISEIFLDTGMMTSLSYIASRQSDRNSVVESMHRRIHKLSDHQLLGSTYGRHTERGEAQAEMRARHTLFEAIKDTARAIHHHNTTVQPDVVLTLEMKKGGVKKTPLDMTRWAIDNGKIACSPMGIDEARIRLLPVHEGVFTESGVRLLRPDVGEQRIYIRCLRYVSKHNKITEYMEAARAKGVVYGDFMIDIFNLENIWFKDIHTGELISLDLVSSDADLRAQGTWSDVMAFEKRSDVDKYFERDEKNCSLNSFYEKQKHMKDNAEYEYQKEASGLDKPMPKSKITGDRKINRDRERTLLINGVPIMHSDGDLKNSEYINEVNIDRVKSEKRKKNSILHDALISNNNE